MLYKYIIKFFFFHFLVNINNNLIDLDVADKSAKKKYILIIIIKKKILYINSMFYNSSYNTMAP